MPLPFGSCRAGDGAREDGRRRARGGPRSGHRDAGGRVKDIRAEHIRPVLAAGQRVFGENRVQEARSKWPGLRAEFAGVRLHLIGPLQSNKAHEAVELFDTIEDHRPAEDRQGHCRRDGAAEKDGRAVRAGQHRRGAAEGGHRAEGPG